jgi:hypothetical protein
MPNFDDVPRLLNSVDTMQNTTPTNHSTVNHRTRRRAALRKQATGVFAILMLTCLGLTACGGSSGTSSNAAATAASTTGSAAGASTSSTATGGSSSQGTAAGAGRRRFGAIRECLQKSGVTLPQRSPGSGAPGGGFQGAGGGPTLPKGVTRAQFEAAMKKCGGGNFGARSGRNGGAGFRRVNSPVFQAALTKYAACLRQNGIDIPAPNTSGKGPIFNTKGIDTSSAKFSAARLKCRASLTGAFRRPQGAAGASGTATTAPPSSTTGD